MTQQIPKDIVKDSLVPIIVGVTGHLYVDSDQDSEIKKVFNQLDRKYPNTPIVILSPLAEGADRLVAKVALNLNRRKKAPVTLVCPLPMLQEEYENDFDPDSKREFGEILEKSSVKFELPLAEGNTYESIKEKEGESRRRQYEQVGKYIAQHSHILIALWDGVNQPEKTGGTSEIVRIRQEGLSGEPLDEVNSGPIFHFMTAKDSKKRVIIHPLREIFPGMDIYDPISDESSEKQKLSFYTSLERLDIFNKDINDLNERFREEIIRSREYCFPNQLIEELSGFTLRLLNYHAITDALALRYQRSTGKTIYRLFILAFLALLCFELYAHLLPHVLILAAYPLIIAFGLILVYLAENKLIQKKYLYFRTLAEFLRIHLFICLLGETTTIRPNLRKKDKLDWSGSVNRAVLAVVSFATIYEAANTQSSSISELPQQLKLISNRWVEDQARYFRRLSEIYESRLKVRHFIIGTFFLAGPASAFILLILELVFWHEKWLLDLHPYLVTAIGTTLAIAATIGGYTGKTGLAASAERFYWMNDRFKRAVNDLKRKIENEDYSGAKLLLMELFELALAENVDWLISGLEHKIEIPKG